MPQNIHHRLTPPWEVLEAGIIHFCRDFIGTMKQITRQSDDRSSFNPGYGLDRGWHH